MSKKVIYFDGGGSGIRAGANIDGTKSEAKNFAGFSHGEVDLVDYLADVVSKYANEIGGDISRAVLATATLPADAARYDAIASLVFQKSDIQELWICSDSVSSCAAAISGDGVVIAAGTGITALAVGKSRTMLHSLSGDGYLIGDEASAYWIGKMGLSAALRARDGRDQSAGSAQLLEVACEHFNTEPYYLPHIVHQQERAVHGIANFALQVSELAATGNTKAVEIIDAAGEEVALIANTAKRECNGGSDFQVALIGGVLATDTLVYKSAVAKIEKLGMKIHASGNTPLDGAEILAMQSDAGVFAPMIKIYKVGSK
ncbi:MAG: hypothetical protein NT057_00065 [Actinobacteria bacterium]|jgi:N-acetylglucosamine kinase-like BadF-type ATPase|nr:hypothetical protein [Actinomycetota bacterium]